MRGFIRAIAAALVVLAATAAGAADRVVVVELFTSQGCSSCPPADEILTELSQRTDVLPLALHVDYWDYIGWKDTFAQPAFTKRQRAYARIAGDRSIYTPQMIVGGREHVIGTRPMQLAEIIESHMRTPDLVDVALTRRGSTLEIDARPRTAVPGRYVVTVVNYRPSETVAIGRGENAGKTMLYSNIVLSMTEVDRWDGKSALRTKATVPTTDKIAVLVQREGPGRIVGCALLP